VGVDINMASAPLLARVSGLNKTLSQNIVKYRDENGVFTNRSQLKKVARLGPKAFEQCAGFLRISNGTDPLDSSSVHPEAYPVVKRILMKTNIEVSQLIGNSESLKALNADDFTDEKFGLPTVTDIIEELDKPGRDPRPQFKTATFKEGVETVADLKPGMILEGVVSNVANFGAFVDVGVHQDGLVHISSITNKFISDPREIVKAGDIVKVKVVEVDVARKRISFTMRLDDDINQAPKSKQSHKPQANKSQTNDAQRKPQHQAKPKAAKPRKESSNAAMGNAFADAFAKLKK
jgi:uncharacterized protein